MTKTSTLKFTVDGNGFTRHGGFDPLIAFVKEAENLGYDFIRLLDHVVGVVVEKHPEMPPTPYTHHSEIQEVFTLMGYLSAATETISFITGVLGLPQRQTALVAKQAAQVDLMSRGRLILGVGIGYNSVEFQAMGADFKTRGARVEEQVAVLRALWTQDSVKFDGDWHTLDHVNVCPPPTQKPIPIWMGAGRQGNPVPPPKVVQRIARHADGFMPLFRLDEKTGRLKDEDSECLNTIHGIRADLGRADEPFGLEVAVWPDGKGEQQVMDEIGYLASIGVTHVHARFPATELARQIDYIRNFAGIRDAYQKQAA